MKSAIFFSYMLVQQRRELGEKLIDSKYYNVFWSVILFQTTEPFRNRCYLCKRILRKKLFQNKDDSSNIAHEMMCLV